MNPIKTYRGWLPACLVLLVATAAHAQTFRVQCPPRTTMHSGGSGIKCQQLSGGDGFATMADGTQTYMFSFGPLSGLYDIRRGLPGTQIPSVFNQTWDDFATDDPGQTHFNGAVGLTADPEAFCDGLVAHCGSTLVSCSSDGDCTSQLLPANRICVATVPGVCNGTSLSCNSDPACQFSGHVDPYPIMQTGIMNGNIPAPLIAIDEDDELFLTLTNVGQIMRPDLFEQHTVHFHGYPNASAYFDGVPDASVAVNIGGSFTYYYLAPDAGTYFWHCHITPPEHLQMGMVGQLYVRPRQNRVTAGTDLGVALKAQQADNRTKCGDDILCSSPLPAGANPTTGATGVPHVTGDLYAYNDGDGSTRYDVEYPIQIHGFDPNFHFVGMTFNPEGFTDMKDKYFLLNGRSYPDTVGGNKNGTLGPMYTQSTDGVEHPSQPLPTLINIPKGGKALLRISDLDVTEYQTLASLGIPMHVVGLNARLLRDLAGNDLTYYSNSITLAGGESLDVILDATDTAKYPGGSTFALFTPNLDHLSNDAENFGGLMTEVNICPDAHPHVDPVTKKCVN
jgi:FtsP/CotA-like multicopper oxidase with cupredoxin domain